MDCTSLERSHRGMQRMINPVWLLVAKSLQESHGFPLWWIFHHRVVLQSASSSRVYVVYRSRVLDMSEIGTVTAVHLSDEVPLVAIKVNYEEGRVQREFAAFQAICSPLTAPQTRKGELRYWYVFSAARFHGVTIEDTVINHDRSLRDDLDCSRTGKWKAVRESFETTLSVWTSACEQPSGASMVTIMQFGLPITDVFNIILHHPTENHLIPSHSFLPKNTANYVVDRAKHWLRVYHRHGVLHTDARATNVLVFLVDRAEYPDPPDGPPMVMTTDERFYIDVQLIDLDLSVPSIDGAGSFIGREGGQLEALEQAGVRVHGDMSIVLTAADDSLVLACSIYVEFSDCRHSHSASQRSLQSLAKRWSALFNSGARMTPAPVRKDDGKNYSNQIR